MPTEYGRLPDFLIIGAAKCGTSTLFSYLLQHSKVFGPVMKEPCFFDEAANWNRGLEWYRSLFGLARDDQVCGEASTNYSRYPQVPGVPERIKATIPNAKLIYLIRHPVERAYSHYIHRHTKEVRRGEPFRIPFEEFIEQDPMCTDGSDYALQLERYFEHFDREQILVLRQDELRRSPRTLLAKTQRFLGIEEEELVSGVSRVENETRSELRSLARRRLLAPLRRVPGLRRASRIVGSKWRDRAVDLLMRTPYGSRVDRDFAPPPMLPETRRRLAERYQPSIDRLERILGEDLSSFRG